MLPLLVTEEIQSIVGEEIRLIAVEQIETAMQYFKPANHECSTKIEGFCSIVLSSLLNCTDELC